MLPRSSSSAWFRPALFVAGLASLAGLPNLHATDGMNMEGYGPIATAMGGTSMAYDNGTAAVINNPATLGLQGPGARLDLALGLLGPDVKAVNPAGQTAKSESTAFFMPAFGYTRRSGDFVYGLGVFGQGGMGTQYNASTWRGLGANLENRTEVSVGRLIAPISWNVSDKLTLAATVDFIWAGMDLRMAMTGMQFADLITPGMQRGGHAAGTIVQTFGQIMQTMPPGTSVDYAYFDFSNGNPMTGAARGYGYGGKVGLLYQPSADFSFGLTYHTETELGDLKASGHNLAFQLNVPGMGHVPQSLVGDFSVMEFEWPALLAAGVAWRPAPRWLVTADVRQIYWSGVMKQFHMTFKAAGTTGNGGFGGQDLDAVLYQNWKDQTVVMAGAAYAVSDTLTLRFGGSVANNPVPAFYLNELFPATVEKHLTAGFGWKLSARTNVDFSYTHGFEVNQTNGGGVTVSHAQNNAQVMYSVRF